jgi:hypothetical protein
MPAYQTFHPLFMSVPTRGTQWNFTLLLAVCVHFFQIADEKFFSLSLSVSIDIVTDLYRLVKT